MELSAEQKAIVADWIARGDKLADVQRNLESEFGLRMTYMDVRFLIDDLALELPKPPPSSEPESTPEINPEPEPASTGKVSVALDKITRPGALVSGSVVFSDGKKATWMLDQMGRLGLDGVGADYRPPAEDVTTFQTELQLLLRKAGYA